MTAALWLFFLAVPVSIAAMNLACGVLTLAVLWNRRRLTWDPRWNWAVAALGLYAAWGLLCSAFGLEPSLRYFPKDLHKLWVLAVVLPALRAEPSFRPEKPLAVSFACMALFGLAQAAFVPGKWGAWTRAHAFVHPVTFGEQMALAVLGAACWLRADRRALPVLVMTAAALVFSQTRGALIGAAAGLLALAATLPRGRRLVLGGALAAAGLLMVVEQLPSRGRSLRDLTDAPTIEHGKLVNPSHARWVLWDAALSMFKARPWTGFGPGNFGKAFPRYFTSSIEGESVWYSAHNLYFQQLAERGLPGLLILLGALGVLVALAWKAVLRQASPPTRWALCALAAFLVMNLTETAFQNEQIATLTLAIWALGQRS